MLILIAAVLLYAVAITLAAFANRNAQLATVSLIMSCISVVPTILMYVIGIGTSGKNTRSGIVVALAAGVLISLATVAMSRAQQLNKLSIVSPVVYGGTIVLTSLLGMWLFKEKITPLNAFGIVLVVAGIGCVVVARVRA